MNAIDRTDLDTRSVFGADAWLGDDIGHRTTSSPGDWGSSTHVE
jgi:hypothetical protein